MKKIHIEGWRFINHSYALVNQHQILALLRRGDVDVSFADLPLYDSNWQQDKSGFDAAALEILGKLPNDPAGCDIALRYSYPYDFSPFEDKTTYVFGTSEFSALSSDQVRAGQDIAAIGNTVEVLTSSHWSKQGFVNSGVMSDRVHVVSHGVDTETFRPDPKVDRQAIRAKLSAHDENFLFLNIGAMTTNKGIEQLLTAFAKHRQNFPNSLLILKGQDSLYGSGRKLNNRLKAVAKSQGITPESILGGLRYIGDDLAPERLADLYRAADAYVSPYLAEGFNLPVLEAVASGLPIICTAGGPTEDFCNDQFCWKIDSKLADYTQGRQFLSPNIDHLVALMGEIQHDEGFRQQAKLTGPIWAQEKFTWDAVAERLISVIL